MKKLGVFYALNLLIVHVCLSYPDQDWLNKSSRHFTIHYEASESAYIDELSSFCESEFDRGAEFFGLGSFSGKPHFAEYFAFSKSKISVYLHSNVTEQNYILTRKQILKRTIDVQFQNQLEAIKQELQLKIAQIITGNMTAGPFSKRKKVLSRADPWFYYGAAYYFSPAIQLNDFSETMDCKNPKSDLGRMKGVQAMLEGAKVFGFIESDYGAERMKNIFNLMIIVGNQKRAISGTLGIEYDEFLDNYCTSVRDI